jgi:hypothetical protein
LRLPGSDASPPRFWPRPLGRDCSADLATYEPAALG